MTIGNATNKPDAPGAYMESTLGSSAPLGRTETAGPSRPKLEAVQKQDSPQARSTTVTSEPRESSATNTVDLSVENSALKAENKALKSSMKTGAANLFTALSVFSGGPWAALAQPLFKVAVNAVSKAINAFKSEGEGLSLARFQKAAGGFMESVKSDFGKTIDTLKEIKKDPTAFFASKENSTKALGTVGSVVGGLIGAAIFSPAGPLGAAIGAGIGFYLGKLAGEALGPKAASYAETRLAAREEQSDEPQAVATQTDSAEQASDENSAYVEVKASLATEPGKLETITEENTAELKREQQV